MERDGYDWESKEKASAVFDYSTRIFKEHEHGWTNFDYMISWPLLFFLMDTQVLRFCMYLISKRHAAYARGIECKHDAIPKSFTKIPTHTDAIVTCDDDFGQTPRNCRIC